MELTEQVSAKLSREAWIAEIERRRWGQGRETVDDGTYGIKRALPVVGDVWLAFRRFLEDPFVTFIRCHLSHQPATTGPNQIDLAHHARESISGREQSERDHNAHNPVRLSHSRSLSLLVHCILLVTQNKRSLMDMYCSRPHAHPDQFYTVHCSL
jgi:hypothetical protein